MEYISRIPNKNILNARRIPLIASVIFVIYLIFRLNPIPSPTNIIRFEKKFLTNISSNKWLILSSNKQLQKYLASPQQNTSIIFIGNYSNSNQLPKQTNIIFLTHELQSRLGFRSTNPKTVAYLLAIKYGARFIYENITNIPFHHQQQSNVQHVAFRRRRSPFVNIYPTFTANFTHSSPGLPKDELLTITQDGWSSIRIVDHYQETIHPLIQQQIIVYCQNQSLVVNHPPIAIEPYTFSPFSHENILFHYDAFWGLVLSESTKSDVWRSWWVQRLLWDINGHLIFTSSSSSSQHTHMTMTSTNTQHNIQEDENVGKLVRYLSSWKSNKATLVERIEQLTNDMIAQNFCNANQLKVIKDWLDDLKGINYVFPSLKTTTSQENPSLPRRRRTAVCLTGLTECIEEAWRPTFQKIRSHMQGEMDVFMYLSSTEPTVALLPTIPLYNRLVEVLRYANFTVKVLFENIPKVAPRFPPNCTSDDNVDQPGFKVPRYYQQLFGLSNCFALVRDYEKKHNIKYDLMVRSRGDIEFLRIPATFDRPGSVDINTTLILPPNRYASKVDDGFAVGPIDAIELYMNRYFSFEQCITRDLHPERYLYFYLNYRKVKVVVDEHTLVGHIEHSPQHCH